LTQILSSTSSKASESCRCPAVVTVDKSRHWERRPSGSSCSAHPRPAQRLPPGPVVFPPGQAVSPPAEQGPSCHSTSPCAASRRGDNPRHRRRHGRRLVGQRRAQHRLRHVLGRLPACVVMGPNHGRVHRDRQPLSRHVAASLQFRQHPTPGAVGRPTPMAVVDRLPTPVGSRQIPQRRARPSPPQHPLDHLPMIPPRPTPARRPTRQQRLQSNPFHIGQVMTIMHTPATAAAQIRLRKHALYTSGDEWCN
jgi:hypothetical protein